MSITQPFAATASHDAIVERDKAQAELERAQRGVTVCVTYHNEPEDTLHRALNSVFAQTVSAYEIIVVDDGSDEPLGDLLPGTFLRVVRITNRGLPAARNTGLMLAKTLGVVFLDADDWLREDYIELTLPLLLEGADVVLTGLQEHGPHRNGRYNPGFDRPWEEVTVELLIDDYNRFFYAALWRAGALREMGGYHPAMAGWPGVAGGYEDWTTWIDAMRRGLKFDAVNEPLLNYNTATPNSMLARAERNRDALVAEMRRHHRLDNPAAPS